MQEVTLVLRSPVVAGRCMSAQLTRHEYEQTFGIGSHEVMTISSFARAHMLGIKHMDAARRIVDLEGAYGSIRRAFGTSGPCDALSGCRPVPEALSNVVHAVLWPDGEAIARPYFDAPAGMAGKRLPRLTHGYYPHEVASLYNFPAGLDGSGQTIGLIELGGGYRPSDIERYFTQLGLPVPDVSFERINGVGNAPSVFHSHDREVMLDILVAGAVAPRAKIVVYFAPNNNKGFYDAVSKAVHDKKNNPGVISISWGAPEKKWDKRVMQSLNEVFRTAAMLGVSVCVASGDSGSNGGLHDGNVHVDFPSSSPWVLACGGTRMMAKEKTILSEVVWHEGDNAAGGGGISEVFPLPDYQFDAKVPRSLNKSRFLGRGVPDVAGNAAHSTGYKIIVNGKPTVIGGTSAVAPLYAGLIALLNQQNGRNSGFLNPRLYKNAHLFREIVKGNNVTARSKLGFSASPGWNACTGLGVHSAHWLV